METLHLKKIIPPVSEVCKLEQWKSPTKYFLSFLIINENFSHALNVLECSVYNEQEGHNT
jgi:hypothetical protein